MKILSILAKGVSHYFFGHAHEDKEQKIAQGDRPCPVCPAARSDLWLVQATTAGASTRGDGYRGYRLVKVVGNKVASRDYLGDALLSSVPKGNLSATWISKDIIEISSWLPLEARNHIRLLMPVSSSGYKLVTPSGDLPILDVSLLGSHLALYTEVQVPGSKEAERVLAAARKGRMDRDQLRKALEQTRRSVKVQCVAATGNSPPIPKISLLSQEPLVVGEPARLSAAGTYDPEDDQVRWLFWRAGLQEGQGESFEVKPEKAGNLVVELHAMDQHAGVAVKTASFKVLTREQALAYRQRMQEAKHRRLVLAVGGILVLGASLLWLWTRRKGRGDKTGAS